MSNPNSAIFPGGVPSYSNLPIATDTFYTTLVANIDNSQTSSINLGLGTLNIPGIIVIDTEYILVTALSGSTITNCVRGFGGTTPATHSTGTSVSCYIIAWNNNQVIAEIIAICSALGAELSNIIENGEAAGGNLSGTYPNPSVAAVGSSTASQIANAVANSHAANQTTVNTVSYSSTPVFDMSLGGMQVIELTGNVSSSTLSNLAIGDIITFFIKQNGAGGNTFVWPSNVVNGMTIGSGSNAVSVQDFKSYDGVTLYATSIGLIS